MTTSIADLVIVGASFAGLTCARAAALRGLRVVVIEAKSDPGARIHTTGILVKEAVEEHDVPAHLTRLVPGVRLYAPNLRHIDLGSPGNYFLTTDTAGLLRWLADEARRAGAQVRCASRFEGARRDADGIMRLSGHDLACRYLVGADGARSAVARNFGLGRNQRFCGGIRCLSCGMRSLQPPPCAKWRTGCISMPEPHAARRMPSVRRAFCGNRQGVNRPGKLGREHGIDGPMTLDAGKARKRR